MCSINSYFELSAILMIIAIMFDSVDGWVARKTKRDDRLGFGKNIDSLSDVVSFGVAPAVFIYTSINTTSIPLHVTVILVSLLIVVCGVLRLTRYNVIADHVEINGFIGFPIPGMSFIVATLYLSGLYSTYLALLLSAIVAVLMISNVKYPKFANMPIIAISCILIILIILPIPTVLFNINIPALILLLFCLYYLIINLIRK
ncbi:MAG: archaetidylserine synthase [Methanobrevibacter sp.]|nr:archaetidylserine synthase [Methanobrevibacter sp.]MDO5861144.1 archaetidylserine synthase [Methanobrevibacter sp.]